jgi:hypothetical protein
MASKKEKCFHTAYNNWKDATGKDLGAQFEKAWTKNADGLWEPDNRNWWHLVRSWVKTRLWLEDNSLDPGSVRGLRRPDITMPGPNGKDMAVEKKFTDKNGNPDEWRGKQKDDYEAMNKQNQGESKAPTLDKKSCECQGEPRPQEVRQPATSPAGSPIISPFSGGVPAGGTVEGISDIPEVPIGELAPVF